MVAPVRHLAARLQAVETELAAAPARDAELAAELARRGGPPKPPRPSSTPPSKGWKRAHPAREGAQRGRPFGHPGTSRRRAEPDRVVLGRPTHCGSCGHELVAAPPERVGISQVGEWPPVRPVVLAAWRYAATGPACGATTAAADPAGFEPPRVFGPHREALWTSLHARHHVG